jgi:hypothetical protein
VVAYAVNEKKTRIKKVFVSKTGKETTLKIQIKFGETIFGQPTDVFKQMEMFAGKAGELRYLGNFMKPFVEFAMRANGVHRGYRKTYTITHDNNKNKTRITLEGDSFCYCFTPINRQGG